MSIENLLIHNCTYTAPGTFDRDGNETAGTVTELTAVRFDAILATQRATEGEAKNDRLTFFYFPGISGGNITPQENAKITWNGNAYTIREVIPRYTKGGDSVHHYEAALV